MTDFGNLNNKSAFNFFIRLSNQQNLNQTIFNNINMVEPKLT